MRIKPLLLHCYVVSSESVFCHVRHVKRCSDTAGGIETIYRIIVKRRQVCGCLSQGWQYNFTSLLFPSQIAANLFRLATDSSPKAASVDTVWWCTQQQPLISYQPTNHPTDQIDTVSVPINPEQREIWSGEIE